MGHLTQALAFPLGGDATPVPPAVAAAESSFVTGRDISVVDSTGKFQLLDGDLVLTTELESIRQDVQSALKFYQGEWYLDLRYGVPYRQDFFIKNPSTAVMAADWNNAILACVGMLNIQKMAVAIGSNRVVTGNWQGQSTLGPLGGTVGE